MEDCVLFKQEGKFFRILLNRPEKLNSLSPDVFRSLIEAIEIAAKSDSRFVLIESTSSKAFAAGADISYLSSVKHLALNDFINLGKLTFKSLQRLPQISFSVVNGYCLGGGLELALSTDFIIATKSAKFGLPETTLGLIPGFSGFFNGIKRLGYQNLKKLILSGKIFELEAAKQLGLVDYEVENSDFDTVKALVISEFGNVSPKAISQAKQLFNTCLAAWHEYWDAEESLRFRSIFESEEALEGLTAFLERRKAKFVLEEC